jgi:hypothetical protein
MCLFFDQYTGSIVDDREPAYPAEEQKDPDVEVARRQDAHGWAEVETTRADGAALLVLSQ